jgi:hypothetical protein
MGSDVREPQSGRTRAPPDYKILEDWNRKHSKHSARYTWAAGEPRRLSPHNLLIGSRDRSSLRFLASVGAVLRGADEHFDEVVVEGVVELALEAPFELRVVEIAGVEIEVVGVHGEAWILELDDDFDGVAFGTGGKRQQRVLIEPKLVADPIKTGVDSFRHGRDCNAWAMRLGLGGHSGRSR